LANVFYKSKFMWQGEQESRNNLDDMGLLNVFEANQISRLLTATGKTSREIITSKEPAEFVAKISVVKNKIQASRLGRGTKPNKRYRDAQPNLRINLGRC
jgi:hypothetical protein